MSLDEDKSGIGTATQHFSDWENYNYDDPGVAPSDWENYSYDFGKFSGDDPFDLQNLPDVIGKDSATRALLYSNEGYGPGMTGDQTSRYDKTLDLTGSKSLANIAASGNWSDLFKSIGGAGKDFLTSKGGLAALMALLAYLDRQKAAPQGGGATEAYAGYSKPLNPQMVQGKYGPIRTYAANGGLMQAYANGGKVQMEDGGFVMTKKAVDGAGGPRGIQQLVPGARMIGGPPDPTGRRDLTPAVIHGPNGTTPAKVSSGEAYVPRAAVQQAGGPDRMYEIMKKLQGSA